MDRTDADVVRYLRRVRLSLQRTHLHHPSSAVTSRNQPPDELQITAHIGLYRRGAVGLKLCPSVKSHVSQRVDHGFEVDSPFSKVVRVVLEMNLTDSRAAQPADLLHHVESIIGRISNIVVGKSRGRPGTIHDSDIVTGRNRILESEDNSGLLGN